jgi:hypothetical protein
MTQFCIVAVFGHCPGIFNRTQANPVAAFPQSTTQFGREYVDRRTN